MAYEEPSYQLLETNKLFEVRRYDDRVVVQTESNSSSEAFRRLFRYITGNNADASKVAMTVPVNQGTKIDMTVPVSQKESDGARYMQFFLPGAYSIENAPRPNDPKVSLGVEPGGKFAVLKYSGRATTANFKRKSKELREALENEGRLFLDNPIRATYNGPFTPFFLRRNEVMFSLQD